ncbi:class I SAM-dependent methyltransferase [Saxibacter everestensis]|uniref:Class I SAM-dependent methyltransferase n=1 Tax=Saxibacter everestensis TaxID=2909229 RepID=A0ABY8QQM8_9MICO|nr:class I SAM-dependent methyltransferase [Brevibacteriaceae bacterium ZFBP1038]
MTIPEISPPPAGSGKHLTFNSPLSAERADRMLEILIARKPMTILDLGCGWAELLLRIAAKVPEAVGKGIDLHEPDIVRAQRTATARGIDKRVSLIHGDASEFTTSADVVINIGAFQAFGTIAEALVRLRELVLPGGCLMFGAEYWEQTPTPEQLSKLWDGTAVTDCQSLAELVDEAISAGFRPMKIETITRNEWEDYETGHMADREIWLAANPDHPEAIAVKQQLDSQRSIWLRGHRDVLGFAYLILIPTLA